MYLKALSINGFKSFAKKSELEFHSPITAIVGPNGSGKSNVAEAFRFVLGEQSVKSMRGKRGEDLIWGGSESASRGNRAGVEVVLDNAKRVFALDFDEVKIERVVHRDGQNEYKLNGSTVRLKDILELLSGANIGATGHHIISQGEADRILSASSRERREMIEDALGLKSFQYKKQEAESKLSKTLINVSQAQMLRKEASPHLRFLEKQVKKLERSAELRSTLEQKYNEYLKREDLSTAKRQDALKLAKRQPIKDLEDINQKLEEAKEALRALETSDSSSELIKLQESWQKATKERQEIERIASQIDGQVELLTRRLEKSSQRQAVDEGKTVSFLAVRDRLQELREALSSASSLSSVEDVVSKVNKTVESFESWLLKEVGNDDHLEGDKNELQLLGDKLKEHQEKLSEAVKKESLAHDKYSTMQTERETQLLEGREAEREVFEYVGKRREVESEIERIENELRVVERDRDEFKRELQEAVTLIGRGVCQYFEYVVKDGSGNPVSEDEIVNESRDKQQERRRELERIKIRLEEMGIGSTEEITKEYKEAKERDEFLEKEILDLEDSVEKLRSLISELEEKLNEKFYEGIEKISMEFNRFFTLMFGGGTASVKVVKEKVSKRSKSDPDLLGEEGIEEEEEEVTRDGVELSVVLPNKRVKGLEMLSGGERALTSIALIFAMSQVNPPPFIILDETDAALDEANSRRYGDMIEALSKQSQLILITHNRETMSRAGVLYGVTMGADGVSKLLSIKLDEAIAVAK